LGKPVNTGEPDYLRSIIYTEVFLSETHGFVFQLVGDHLNWPKTGLVAIYQALSMDNA